MSHQIYHPFVCGPWNRIKQELVDKYGVRINVPPPSVNRDEITVTGDKEGVMAAVQVSVGQNLVVLRHRIIHFPTSSGVRV